MEKISLKNIQLDIECSNKEEVFETLAKMSKEYCDPNTDIVQLYKEREEQISTGMQDGFAIPHAKGKGIKNSAILFIRLKKPIEWETFDNKPVSNIVSFLIPEDDKSYLDQLAKVAQSLQNKEFINKIKKSKEPEEILKTFIEVIEDESKSTKNSDTSKDKIIAGICACPAGLAHTYMAKEALENACKDMGYGFKVEAHGSLGVENKLSKEEVKKAFLLIVAADVEVDLGDLENLPVYRCTTNEMIKNPKIHLERALKMNDSSDEKVFENDDVFDLRPQEKEIKVNNKFLKYSILTGRDMLKHMMTGIGYCIPLLIGCGLMVGLSQLIAEFTVDGGGQNLSSLYHFSWDDPKSFVENVKGFNGFLYTMQIVGMNIGLSMLFLMFLGGFIGYSINGKAGLGTGFIIGAICVLRSSGFIGVILTTLVVEYIVKYIIKYLTPKGRARVLGSVLFVPLFGTLLAIIFGWWAFGYPLQQLNQGLENLVLKVSKNQSASIGMAALIAFMMAFDLGGPVNKAGWAAYTVIWSDTTLDDVSRYTPNAAGNLAIGIPVLGVGLSVWLASKYFKQQEKVQGSSCLLMGLLGISEGAIPFLLSKPLRYMLLNITGAIIGACLYVGVGGYLKVGAGIIYGWAFANKPFWYLFSFILGVAWIAILNATIEKISWHRRNKIKFQFFFCKANLVNLFYGIANIFNGKNNKLTYQLTKFEMVKSENNI